MRGHFRRRRFEIIVGLALCTTAIFHTARAVPQESVRAELIRSQEEKGLTLAWVDSGALNRAVRSGTTANDGVRALNFKEAAVVPLKDSIHFFRPDGFNSPEYSALSGIGACWSPDQTQFVDTLIEHPSGRATLAVVDLASKQKVAIAINADQKEYVTSQCWSPDGKSLVYEFDGAVRLYRLESDRSDAIAKGTDPTWSPDGNWIAFRDGDVYYVMHADGSARKELFRNHWGRAVSALYWSPDSRIVAYVRELGFLQGGGLDAEVNQLRVRRIEDGSDDKLCPDSVDWYANYRWITTDELKEPTPGPRR